MSITDTGRVYQTGKRERKTDTRHFPVSPFIRFPADSVLLGVEPLDDFFRDVQARVDVGGRGLAREDDVQALLLRDLLDDRRQPLLELVLQIVLQLLDLGLRVLLRELD